MELHQTNIQCLSPWQSFPQIQLVWPCQANELFVTMPELLAEELYEKGAEFYQWPETALPAKVTLKKGEVFARLVTSFATSDEHISEFCDHIQNM